LLLGAGVELLEFDVDDLQTAVDHLLVDVDQQPGAAL